MIITRCILLRMRNLSDKRCRKNQNKPFIFTLFRKSCRLCDKVEKYGTERQATDDNITRHIRIECGIPKTTNTQSEYVILITCQRQQWLHKSASVLRYTYVARIVRICTWICNIFGRLSHFHGCTPFHNLF
jgi:hypothetical protein